MKKVCIQGLGFVGAATAVAVSSQSNKKYSVIGIDKNDKNGLEKIKKINNGIFPFETSDETIKKQLKQSIELGLLKASHDYSHFVDADIVLVSLPFDLTSLNPDKFEANWKKFLEPVVQLADLINENCLIIFQTTLLPGTIRKNIPYI